MLSQVYGSRNSILASKTVNKNHRSPIFMNRGKYEKITPQSTTSKLRLYPLQPQIDPKDLGKILLTLVPKLYMLKREKWTTHLQPLGNSTTYKKLQGKRRRLEGERGRGKMENPRENETETYLSKNQAPSLPFSLLNTQPPAPRVRSLSQFL